MRLQAAEANRELLELLSDFLPRRYPDRFSLIGSRLVNHSLGQEWDLSDPQLDPLEAAALLVQVCCMGRGGGGVSLCSHLVDHALSL